jgi:1,4-alpha-glucan branching enzyme
MAVGVVALVLHSHLPYVLHHGRFPHGSEWLCEAVAECYLPLLQVVRGLVRRGILPRCTVEFSPVLCEQLAQPAFRVLFQQYCREKAEAAREDEQHFRRYGYGAPWVRLAQFWQSWYTERLQEFVEDYAGALLPAFARLQAMGVLELAASAATHAYLPLLPSERSVAFQVRVGIETYRQHFGQLPRSFWLPECGYYPAGDTTAAAVYGSGVVRSRGVEEILARLGIEVTVVEQQLVERATPWSALQERSLLRPYWCVSAPEASWGCLVLARHQATAARVWDARTGYPGDGDYLDFHKRHYTSWLRYWRVTDNRLDMQYKLLYVPEWAQQKAAEHARHFVEVLTATVQHESSRRTPMPVVCLPFDTELFGHWWFEGPLFVQRFFEQLEATGQVEAWSLGQCRQRLEPAARVRLPAGSWGKDAGHEPWANPQVRWMWHQMAQAEARLGELLQRFPSGRRTPVQERLLQQALRELLLLQSSDWSFLVVTGTAKEYAEQRFVFHARAFEQLCAYVEEVAEQAERVPEAEAYLENLERRDALFAGLRVEWWQEPL